MYKWEISKGKNVREYGRERMGEEGGRKEEKEGRRKRMELIEGNILFKHSSSCRHSTTFIFMLL